MKQPELGMKVTELRQQKAFIQERLAEMYEVSTRTIQRIESGEVDPRSFTIQRLNEALDYDFGKGDLQNENLWLAALHLSSMFCIVFIPLLIWSFLKEKSLKVDRHGRDVLNFQITITILLFVSVICVVLVPLVMAFTILNTPDAAANLPGLGIMELLMLAPILPLLLVGPFVFYQGIKNTIRVLNDKPYHYPLSIQFLR